MKLRSHIYSQGLLSTALVALTVSFSVPSFAQNAQTGIAEPGRAAQTIRDRVTVPNLAPDIQVKKITAGEAPAGAEKIHFTLKSIKLDGATVYSVPEISKVYADKLGKEISLADLYTIAAQLTAKYRNDGYILTQIIVPPQTIDNGTPRLQVIEGTIDQVTVQGDETKEAKALPLIRSYAAGINKDGGPLNVHKLERALLLINDLPGVTARSVIAPSKTKVGAADLSILISRKPFDGALGLDNYGSRYLGRWEGMAAGAANSQLFGYNEKITTQFVYAPHGPLFDRELAYGSVGYWAPIGTAGTNVEVDYSYTNTKPGLDLRDTFHVMGISQYAGVTVKHPFIRTRDLNLTARAILDARSSSTQNNIPDDREDHVRAFRVGGRLESVDALLSGGVNTLDVQASKGLSVFGASNKGGANLTRPDADPQFFKVELEGQRLQRIVNNLNLLLGAKGQYSNHALLASEEYGVGGASYGRGYDPSEITGDEGVSGKVELQWNTPALSWFSNSQLFGFYDVGKVWNKDATTSADKINSLASTGIGVRGDLFSNIQTEAFLAKPLTRDVQTEHNTDSRFYLNISHRF